jgi:hypothetical protein
MNKNIILIENFIFKYLLYLFIISGSFVFFILNCIYYSRKKTFKSYYLENNCLIESLNKEKEISEKEIYEKEISEKEISEKEILPSYNEINI